MLYTALVPSENVDSVLNTAGGLINEVKTARPERAFKADGSHSPQFWISTPSGSMRFESLVNKWDNHNKLVLLPDSALLMQYRLIPEVLKDRSTSWHDLDRPVYHVVRVTPVSRYGVLNGYTTARIAILRDYLEDYLSLKQCVAVATFFDERYSTDEPDVASLIAGAGFSIKQPGRQLWFKRINIGSFNQISQVSASAILMVPHRKPITHPVELSLEWPDHNGPIVGEGGGQFETAERAFVRDEALLEYQDRPEFEVNPESGSVTYDFRWGFSFCNRFGRNHIAFELRKLYEGAPPEIIRHFHNYAVGADVARADMKANGNRNVGVRAKEFIDAYQDFTEELSALADALGLVATQEDFGKLNADELYKNGWWTFDDLKRIGRVIPVSLTFADFLARCKDLFTILEKLNKSPLLQILVKLGLKKDQPLGAKKEPLFKFESLKLAATICQLSRTAIDSGCNLLEESAVIIQEWNPELRVGEFSPLFALNGLRIASAHNLFDTNVEKALDAFMIDQATCQNGWGLALDTVYDGVIASFDQVTQLIRKACYT
jgi:hypothetical protein